MTSATDSSPVPDYPRLLADIGGTHARFALQTAAGGALSEPRTLRCREHAGPAEAIEAYLAGGGFARPAWVSMGVATAISGDLIEMTNHSWRFSVSELRQRIGATRVLCLNDFTALALALPVLPDAELVSIGGGSREPAAAIGVIGAGTGLGVSGLLHGPGGYLPITGEGGHVTLSASSAREYEVIAAVRRQHPHVSAERLVSGPGLVSLHAALAELAGQENRHRLPPDVVEHGLDGSCALCRETLELFCGWLGTLAGDLALTLGARGGIYIGGGIVQRLGDYFATSSFRERFEFKGRFSSYNAGIATRVIHSPWPGILGAGRALDLAPGALGSGHAESRIA